MSHNFKKVGIATLVFTGLACMSNAQAVVANGHSEGAGLKLMSTVNLLNLTLPNVSGFSPAPYNLSNTVIPLGVNIPNVLALNALTLSGSASSDVDGTAGAKFATGTGTINGTVMNLLGVSLTADVLSSTSTVTGDAGSFAPFGSSIITNAVLTIPGLLGGTTIFLNPSAAPNTVISNPGLTLLGISIILNEQIPVCSATMCSEETNAIHINVNPILGLNLVDVDLKLGHSFASLTAAPVPEASEWAMMLAGIGLIGLQLRRRSGGAHTIRA